MNSLLYRHSGLKIENIQEKYDNSRLCGHYARMSLRMLNVRAAGKSGREATRRLCDIRALRPEKGMPVWKCREEVMNDNPMDCIGW